MPAAGGNGDRKYVATRRARSMLLAVAIGLAAFAAPFVEPALAESPPDGAGAEPPSPVGENATGGPRQLPWAWTRVQPPAGWRAVSTESLPQLAFERPADESRARPSRAWVASLPLLGQTDLHERVHQPDVRLPVVDWADWTAESPHGFEESGRRWVEVRFRHARDDGPRRTLALTRHGALAVLLLVDGEGERDWYQPANFAFEEPRVELRGRLSLPGAAGWDIPVPLGYQVRRNQERLLELFQPATGDRLLWAVIDLPHAQDLDEAIAAFEWRFESEWVLRRTEGEALSLDRLDVLLASCTLGASDRIAWIVWAFDASHRQLLVAFHDHAPGRHEHVRDILQRVALPALQIPAPSTDKPAMRVANVRLAAEPADDGGLQLAIAFVDSDEAPVVVNGVPFVVRITLEGLSLIGVESLSGSDSADLLPGGWRAAHLRVSPDLVAELREFSPQATVRVDVDLGGVRHVDDVPLGVLLAP